MAISHSRKMNMAGLAVLLLVGTVVSWWPLLSSRWQMHRFCAGLTTGTSPEGVQAQAMEQGYDISMLADGRTRIEHPRSLGRATCDVRFGAQGLVSADD
jgi:hypothetical protein